MIRCCVLCSKSTSSSLKPSSLAADTSHGRRTYLLTSKLLLVAVKPCRIRFMVGIWSSRNTVIRALIDDGTKLFCELGNAELWIILSKLSKQNGSCILTGKNQTAGLGWVVWFGGFVLVMSEVIRTVHIICNCLIPGSESLPHPQKAQGLHSRHSQSNIRLRLTT